MKISRRITSILLFTSFIVFLTACKDELNKGFSTKYPARFYLETVQCNDLHNAMMSTGIYVSIKQVAGMIEIETANGAKTKVTPSAVAKDFRYGLGGFIVGRSYMGEALAYDLSCPTCDRTATRLKITDNGYAICAKCGIEYDLNNYGVIFKTPDPAPENIRSLYRYHIYYDGNVININN